MKIKMISFIFIVCLIVFISLFYFSQQDEPQVALYHKNPVLTKSEKLHLEEDHTLIVQQNAVWKYVNQDIEEFIAVYGEPDRKDSSLYGFDWWIFQKDNYYIQVAVQNETIISIYSNSETLDFHPLVIGQSSEEISDIYQLKEEIEFDHLRFKLTEEDLKQRPVVRLSEEVFAQLYMDQFTEKLSGLRILNKEGFELLKPYELYYWGEIKEVDQPDQNQWEEIEEGLEQQIFDLTNEIRSLHDLNTLTWDDQAAEAAKAHSKDMFEENYFSHYSLNGDGLKERLIAANASYLAAGENIAAHYIDAPAVIHGWLNSEGHREALLKEDYTHLGVGVYQSFYTQNFIQK
ncbi:CAP domain-containing protein [Gracilibacillus sp. HCP3S3_G5_1]|uniref:CAP domain-containing protein n=1 Tax=unclassified Gracilibacillus TaxID=2625209 RepID=UPI003F8B2A5A